MARASNIRPRGKSFRAYLRVNGEHVERTFKTRDEAEVWVEQQRERRRAGEEPERPTRVTFDEAAEAWYSDRGHEKGWSPATWKDYRSVLDVWLLPYFAGRRLEQITPRLIKEWRTREMTFGHTDGSGVVRVLPRRQAQKALTVLHGVFEHAREAYGFTRSNPAAAVEQVKLVYSGELDFYSVEEVWALVREAESAQDAAVYIVASCAGLRRGEIVGLRVRDVDFAARKLRVERSVGFGVGKSPKWGKVRSVPMAGEVERALATLLTARGNPAGDELVFVGEQGGYLDASALRRRYKRAQAKAGLRPLRFHDLRHTFGSLAVNRASIVQLQGWMGHADVKTTMRYLHYKTSADEAELLDGVFVADDPARALHAPACPEVHPGASAAQEPDDDLPAHDAVSMQEDA
jgi:integrase